ncbi:MAG TPA: hypothetical protein VF790_03675 [Dissulfurispiraceae bacterium]
MKVLKWMACVVFVFLLQTQFFFLRDFLNIPVLLAYYFGLRSLEVVSAREYSSSRAEIGSVLFGAAVGLVEDVLSGSIIGPGLLSKGFIGFMTPVIFTSLVFKWTPLWGGIITVLFTLMDGMILTGTRVLFTGIHVSGIGIFQILLIQALLNLPFGLVLRP